MKLLIMAPSIATSLAILLLFFLAFTSSSLACNKQDLAALVALRDSYPLNTFPASWYSTDPTNDCCLWDYIRCSHRTGRIQRLTISNNANITGPIPAASITALTTLERLELLTLPNVNGSIPPQLSKLTQLRQLAIYNIPNLVGPVPPQLAALTNLELFNIYNTSVTGPIPSFLPKLTKLGISYLHGNKFTSIPASLNLGKLQLGLINWGNNQLSGSIPPYLLGENNTNGPRIFILSDNKLTGELPASFGSVTFSYIYLSNNKLTGSAEVFFGKSKNTTQMSLDHNQLSFDFSKVEFPQALTLLDISHNKIYGSIPESITELPQGQLETIDVSYNDLCGKIPSGGGFPLLSVDSYAHNKCLCGAPLSPCK